MSRIRLIQGVAQGLAKAAKSPTARKVGQAALNQANKLKKAAKAAKPIAQQVAREKAKATGKPVRTTINTAARQQAIARQAARSAKNPPSGERLLLQEKGVTRSTKNTKLAPGVKNDAVKKPPISRTTSPTKAEQVRQVKSGLRDRGQAHVEAQLPKGTKATANQARGDVRSASRNGVGSRVLGQAEQPKSTTGNNKVTGRVRTNSREAGKEAVERFNNKANKIVADRVGQVEGSRERQTLRRELQKQQKAGAKRVQEAASSGTASSQNAAKNNTSRSSAYQDPKKSADAPRSLAQSQASAERLSRDMTARKLAGKLPEINKTPSTTNQMPKASTSEGLKKAQVPSSKDLTSQQTAKPLAKPEAKPNPVRNGQELKPMGEKSVPQSMNTSQRRADPSPQQAKSDAVLRQRNQGTSTPRTSTPPNRSQGSTTGAAAAANRSVDRQGNNLQKMADNVLRAIGWSGRN